jgi:heat shock protein HslJ
MLRTIPILLMFSLLIAACKTKKDPTEEVRKEEPVKREITMESLVLTPALQQALYQLESGHVVSLVNKESNLAVDITQTEELAREGKLHVQFKGAFEDGVIRFESDLERLPGSKRRWIGEDKGTKLILLHRADTVQGTTGTGDLALKHEESQIEKEYFEVGLIKPESNDTLRLSFWSNFYADHRLHGHWVFSEAVGINISPDTYGETPFFELYVPSMKIRGFDGCNHVSGYFQQTGYVLDFGKVISTKRFCEGVNDLLPIIRNTNVYRIEGNRLFLSGERGVEIAFEKEQ